MSPESASWIFWYTGWAVWAFMSVCVAVACGVAAVGALAWTFHKARTWRRVWCAVYLTNEERSIFFQSCRHLGVTEDDWRKFLKVVREHRNTLKKLSRAWPRISVQCGEWYQLNDGTVGQVVSWQGDDRRTGSGDFKLLGADWRMRVRADGVCRDNNAIRIVRRIKRPVESGVVGVPKHPVEPMLPDDED